VLVEKSTDSVIENPVDETNGADSIFRFNVSRAFPSGTPILILEFAPSGYDPIDTMLDWPRAVGVSKGWFESRDRGVDGGA